MGSPPPPTPPPPPQPLPPGLRRPALRTITNPVTHEVATFRRYMAETAGEQQQPFSEIEVAVRAGGGVPLHYHAQRTETFTAGPSSVVYLQRGGSGGGKQDAVIRLAPGATATVRAGEVHRFWNPTAPAPGGKENDDDDHGGVMRFTVRVSAAPGAVGLDEGFEKGLYIWYGLARDGLVRADGIASSPLHAAVIMYLQDTWLAGGRFWLLTPVFAALYAVARWTGVEAELVRRYWTLAGEHEDVVCEEAGAETVLVG